MHCMGLKASKQKTFIIIKAGLLKKRNPLDIAMQKYKFT
jgi:hypothetical protein